jgi:hypothetical protein
MVDETVETLNLKSGEVINFVNHITFEDSIRAELNFDNGYGISIITKSKKRKNPSNYTSFSAQGSWEKGTFEIGITKKNKDGDYVFTYVNSIEDEEYRRTDGIWINLTKDQVEEKINLIKSL